MRVVLHMHAGLAELVADHADAADAQGLQDGHAGADPRRGGLDFGGCRGHGLGFDFDGVGGLLVFVHGFLLGKWPSLAGGYWN